MIKACLAYKSGKKVVLISNADIAIPIHCDLLRMKRRIVLHYVMLCYVMLCYAMLEYVMLCIYIMLHYVMSCYAMLKYVMLCTVYIYIMLCYVMSCYAGGGSPHSAQGEGV